MYFEKDSRLLSLTKGITWRVIGTFDTIIISFLKTENAKKSLFIGFLELFTKTSLYYFHERLWLKFGKVSFSKIESSMKNINLFPFGKSIITKKEIENKLKQKACVFWLTGLSGSGKSTLARELELKLFAENLNVKILDGDFLRSGLCSDLGFTDEDRCENVRRVAEVAKLFLDSGFIVIVSLITPLDTMRLAAKGIVGSENYELVFIDTPFEICEKRDVNGLYSKARSGKLENFTGIGSSFELPKIENFRIETSSNIADDLELFYNFVRSRVNLLP